MGENVEPNQAVRSREGESLIQGRPFWVVNKISHSRIATAWELPIIDVVFGHESTAITLPRP